MELLRSGSETEGPGKDNFKGSKNEKSKKAEKTGKSQNEEISDEDIEMLRSTLGKLEADENDEDKENMAMDKQLAMCSGQDDHHEDPNPLDHLDSPIIKGEDDLNLVEDADASKKAQSATVDSALFPVRLSSNGSGDEKVKYTKTVSLAFLTV